MSPKVLTQTQQPLSALFANHILVLPAVKSASFIVELCRSQEQELLLSQHHKWNTGLPDTHSLYTHPYTHTIRFSVNYRSYSNPLGCCVWTISYQHTFLCLWCRQISLLSTITTLYLNISMRPRAVPCAELQIAVCTYCPRASVRFAHV